MKGWIELNLRILYWIFVAPLRGQRWSLDQTVRQMVLIGVRALPMAALTAFSIGLTLAMQSGAELQKMGASAYVPDLVAVSLLRELGTAAHRGDRDRAQRLGGDGGAGHHESE